MFENVQNALGITKLNSTIELKKIELQQLKQELCERINLLESKSSFGTIEFLKIIKKLINYYFDENYYHQVIISKKNNNSNSYYYILTKNPKIEDINSIAFWNNVEKGNIIIVANMVSKVEPKKISFMAKKQDNMAKFNMVMDRQYLNIIMMFFEDVILSKINNTYVNLDTSFNKFIKVKPNTKIKNM